MNIQSYLKRINYNLPLKVDKATLFRLHQAHLYHIPFEDLNIHYDIPIVLTIKGLYRKVVLEKRGGFCYELNGLFIELLKEVGFKTTLISAKVINKHGIVGPKFDHAAIIVDLDKRWLVDVGYGGDSFVLPKELKLDVIQKDVHDYYKFEKYNAEEWLLLYSSDGENFSKQYIFSFEEQPLANFNPECQRKQIQEGGHFKTNLICTKATTDGRISIYNDRLTIKNRGGKAFQKIENESALLEILEHQFGIVLP